MVVGLESLHDRVRQIKVEVDRIKREMSEQNRGIGDPSPLTRKKQRRIKKLRKDIAETEKIYPDPRNARATKSTTIESSMANATSRQNTETGHGDDRTLAVRIREAGRLLLAGELEDFEGEDPLLRMVCGYHAEDQEAGEDKDGNSTGDQNANVPPQREFTRLDHGKITTARDKGW
ncbi:hypothetical protein LTR51_005030 [Lithohypha guttulata]|uniref:Uncharacterized protein n=1 Tax=Lithohypha guttulata TaxID=1690604 RepID=A0AAN7Y7F1_9EURO|nr:hypothetical protein LTR51_005030 [Lithohypha guttulata]KAK5087778.1 hypothetical protein LTR05_001993 [Lithohypha guttulata]